MSECICNKISKISNSVKIDLIAHHRELKRTSNTGRLIALCLENSDIWVRGKKENPLDHKKVLMPGHQSLLLYPSEEAQVLTHSYAEECLKLGPVQLIVPDGNWRQASKVHYRVKEFEGLQRVCLPSELADRGTLMRKEIKESGMSTLEAIAYALGFFEGDVIKDQILQVYKLKKEATLKLRGVKTE